MCIPNFLARTNINSWLRIVSPDFFRVLLRSISSNFFSPAPSFVMLEHLVGCLNLSSLKFLIGLSCHSDRDLSGLRNEPLHGKFGELAQRHPDLRQLLCSPLCFGDDVKRRNRGSCSRALTIMEFRFDKPRNQIQASVAGFYQRNLRWYDLHDMHILFLE